MATTSSTCTWSGMGLRHYKFETGARGSTGGLLCSIPSGQNGPIHFVRITPMRQKYGVLIEVKGSMATSSPANCAEFADLTGGSISTNWTETKQVYGAPVDFQSRRIQHKHSGTENIHLEVWEQSHLNAPKNRVDPSTIVFPVSLA